MAGQPLALLGEERFPSDRGMLASPRTSEDGEHTPHPAAQAGSALDFRTALGHACQHPPVTKELLISQE